MRFKFYINKPLDNLNDYCVKHFQVKETNKTIDDIRVFEHNLNVKITLKGIFYLVLPISFKLENKNSGTIVYGRVFTLKTYLISLLFSILTSGFFYFIHQNYTMVTFIFLVSFLIVFLHFTIQIKKSLLFIKNMG